MRDPAQRPATLLPPPLIYAAALVGAWALQGRWPLPFEVYPLTPLLGWALIALGLIGMAWAVLAIWGHQTTVNPYKQASHLVESGPFCYSRNPIYVADWLVYLGVMLLLQSAWPLLLAPMVWALMRYAVIAHEESHLAAKFGEEYRAYKMRVRRWI